VKFYVGLDDTCAYTFDASILCVLTATNMAME
jgi:hypothetical protein